MKKSSGSISFRTRGNNSGRKTARKSSSGDSSRKNSRPADQGQYQEPYSGSSASDSYGRNGGVQARSSWSSGQQHSNADSELYYDLKRRYDSSNGSTGASARGNYSSRDTYPSRNGYGSQAGSSSRGDYNSQTGASTSGNYSNRDTSRSRNSYSSQTGASSRGGYNDRSSSGKGRKPSRKEKKKGGCLIPGILSVAALLILVVLLLNHTFSKVEKMKLDRSLITVNKQDKRMKKYQTIALFGVDSQDNVIGDRGSRTDSIIVASINKTTKKVKLMSIYRDTYVSIDGEYDKINAAYSYGGPEQAINTINRNLDLNITDFATVNFKALADAVDILGGITLTINSEKELENLNDYIGNMNHINGGDSPKFDEVGTYTFDGNQAVAYSRIRYMEGGDHARASHQRLVVEGILKKAKRQPWKLGRLVDKVLPQCKTSFTSGQFTRMAMGVAFYDITDSQAYPFDSFDEKYNGIYYGFPTTVESNTIKAHEYLFGTEDYQPTEELLRISEKVQDVADMVGP